MAASPSCCSHGCRFLLLLLVLLVVAAASGVSAAAAASEGSSVVHLNLASLFPPDPTCRMPQEQQHGAATGTRMPVVHQHGPCSPLADKHGKGLSQAEILAADQSRVEYIHRRVSETTGRARPKRGAAPAQLRPEGPLSSSPSANLPASSGNALGTGNYVVTIGLGTPSSRFTVVFDTGSDMTWVQCRPCSGSGSCYQQKDPLFTPLRSSTYAYVSCSSRYCNEAKSGLDLTECQDDDDRDHDDRCPYVVLYGDGSYSVGFYGQDTLELGPDALRRFRFGCSVGNRGLFGRAAGLMGLGRGRASVTVQAEYRYGGVFAYCLPAAPSGTTGFLGFGPGAAPAAASARLTPLLTENGDTFYYVELTGIQVGGHLLPIPESVFSAAGAIMDSGTVITRLPPKAYEALRSAFVKAMKALGNTERAPPLSILDTCYDLSGAPGGNVSLPAVSLVFRSGALLDVDASGILYVEEDVTQACLGFAPNDEDTDVAIVGNTQQKTYAVLHDLDEKVVGFVPGAC